MFGILICEENVNNLTSVMDKKSGQSISRLSPNGAKSRVRTVLT